MPKFNLLLVLSMDDRYVLLFLLISKYQRFVLSSWGLSQAMNANRVP
jgi:hypothetical protein